MQTEAGSDHATWDARQYERFKKERARPFHDLVSRVPEHPVRFAADLGCGTGELTYSLFRRWPSARVWGVDRSSEMLGKAPQRSPSPNLEFIEADLRKWRPPQNLNLIVSNAALQWVPDHAAVLERLANMLAPRGILAVQMPNNRQEPAYRILSELIAEAPWRERLPLPSLYFSVESPSWYAEMLAKIGFESDIWETIYYHQLPSAEAIVEWLKGTALRPILTALPEKDAGRFLHLLSSRIGQAYQSRSVGVLFLFKRLFFIGLRR